MKKLKKFILVFAFVFALTPFVAGCNTNNNTNTINNPITYTLTVLANNYTYGNVYGSGQYTKDEKVVICAVANDGYEFHSWSDGDTNAVRTIKVTSSQKYTASFVKSEELYTLSFVEMYLEEGSTFSAKYVELINFYIYTKEIYSDADNYFVFRQNCFGDVIKFGNGLPFVATWDGKVENYTDDKSFVFNAPRTSANSFKSGEVKSLRYELHLAHSKFDMYPISNHYEHDDLDISVTDTTLKQTVCLYYDSTYDYRVYARLNFIKI